MLVSALGWFEVSANQKKLSTITLWEALCSQRLSEDWEELEVEIPQYSLYSKDFNTHRDMTLGDRTLGMLSPSAFFRIVIMPWIFLLRSGELKKKTKHKQKPQIKTINVSSLFLSQVFLMLLGSVSCSAIPHKILTGPLYQHCLWSHFLLKLRIFIWHSTASERYKSKENCPAERNTLTEAKQDCGP